MTYVIKKKPEDFIVKESTDFEIKDSGQYTCFLLVKRNIPTLEACSQIAKLFGVPLKKIKYAGLKDKKAITTQLCTVEGNLKNKIPAEPIGRINLKFIGFSDRPIGMGMLNGNLFEIVVRNLDTLPDLSDPTFLNLFGEQRFSENNVLLGRLLVQKKFKEFAEIISKKDIIVEEEFKRYGPINALQKVNKRMLRFYLNSYQSHIFNETLKDLTNKKEPLVEKIPLVGFGSDIDSLPDKTKDILKEDKLTCRDFIIRQFPNLSSEGTMRHSIATASKLIVGSLEDDELFEGKKKVKISFYLAPGCYATEFINQKFGK